MLGYFLQKTILVLAIFLLIAPLFGRAEESLLERDVLPILTKQCLGCHGGLRQKGGLDMRTVPLMIKGGESGPALISGNLSSSEMWKKISANEMPPGEKKLSATEKHLIKQWISNGLPTVAEQNKNDNPFLSASAKHTPKEVAGAIDRHLALGLESAKLKAVPQCDDEEFLRRIYIDLTGRVPAPEQALTFLDSKAPNKRTELIDTLLATAHFGEQLGRTWRDWICPPELPSDTNSGSQPHKQSHEFGKWMGDRFSAGDSWEKITREILTVEGEIKSKPQVIFFGLVGDGGKLTADGSARAVASLFMGVQLQCAQCHDDPYRAWAQQDHWALAAFFTKISGSFSKVSEDNSNKANTQITIPKSAFKNSGTNVPAAFLGSKTFGTGKDSPLRVQLVDWLTAKENPFFARSFSNRMWFYFFARGLVNPVDDYRELNPPTHPGLMQLLANEFAASNFDVKHLIRCICNSQAYQRTSQIPTGMDKQMVAAIRAAYGIMPLRVMSADVLYDSLKLAYGDPKLDLRAIDPKDGNTNGESAAVGDAYLEFLRRFGTNKEDATDFTHGIPQMLTMINHPRLLLAGNKAIDIHRKTTPTPSAEQTVEWLYLSTLSRRPTKAEQMEAIRYLKREEGSSSGYAGVLWMLVNRSEYILVR